MLEGEECRLDLPNLRRLVIERMGDPAEHKQVLLGALRKVRARSLRDVVRVEGDVTVSINAGLLYFVACPNAHTNDLREQALADGLEDILYLCLARSILETCNIEVFLPREDANFPPPEVEVPPEQRLSESVVQLTQEKDALAEENARLREELARLRDGREDQRMVCAVCSVEDRAMACLPCGHMAMCGECHRTHFARPDAVCATCRQPVEQSARIFVP